MSFFCQLIFDLASAIVEEGLIGGIEFIVFSFFYLEYLLLSPITVISNFAVF